MTTSHRLLEVLHGVKVLAREYYELTGRPRGVTAEIAEYEAARLLGLTPSPARQAGYDATRATADGEQQLQIKGRCILPGSKPGQRVGAIDPTKQWDAVLSQRAPRANVLAGVAESEGRTPVRLRVTQVAHLAPSGYPRRSNSVPTNPVGADPSEHGQPSCRHGCGNTDADPCGSRNLTRLRPAQKLAWL